MIYQQRDIHTKLTEVLQEDLPIIKLIFKIISDIAHPGLYIQDNIQRQIKSMAESITWNNMDIEHYQAKKIIKIICAYVLAIIIGNGEQMTDMKWDKRERHHLQHRIYT
jgi:hypothetical protein